MNHRIYDRIREILENTPGLTQKGLAEKMGLNPAAINRMLYGRRNIMAEEIPMIEEYLGVRLDLSPPVVAANIEYRQDNRIYALRRGFSDIPAHALPSSHENGMMVPVYGYAVGGLQKRLNFSSGDVVDWVTRHPAQFGIAKAFAIYVFSDAMEPRYFQGELAYIHPSRPLEMNRDCLMEMKSGDACIKRFMNQDEDKIRVMQFNPRQEEDILKEDIKALYAIVGRG